MEKKELKTILQKQCSVCSRAIRVRSYQDKSYRGGHYFGQIFNVEEEHCEYWECPTCYWK